ncbi:MAG: ABC transporter permease subunit [Candidatus Dormiibacterota bacterium]
MLGALVVWLALLGPTITLLAHVSPGAVASALGQPGALAPLVTSVLASALALAVIVLLGTPLAYLLARGRMPLNRWVEGAVLLPLLMPPLVVGLLLVFMVGPATPLGQALVQIHLTAADTFFALVVAEVYEAVPYYVLGAEAAFATVDQELETAGALLGDSSWRTLRRVTVPLAAPGLASALALTWARAMGAFGAVLIIAYHPFGLPMQIWTTLQESGLSSALPFALVLVLVALPLPIAAYIWSARARRRL